ncbi:DUF4304 domain-containing protein [Chryseobacterium fluminis]|uniref:DUF4304 domain-containing protein n=1 Tax=Chryseobacterium fluminis TaxID=2983606 RepID=UPI00225B9323|nr:DUF4304 domain-containing protein [Chryseobacterium sp. MMS21-Ot14]UZT99171.1 DUF4304 domain-containing protein [Chryseobacterium sp. MMS21-Ot14]
MNIFKELIKAITPFLQENGYRKKGSTFYIKSNKNYGIVNFQRSQNMAPEIVKFTINLGIYSDVLGKITDWNYDTMAVPEVSSCHWQSRIGCFRPEKQDYWWEIRAGDSLQTAILDVKDNIQNIIIPEISKRISDEDLMNRLLNNEFMGSTNLNHFKYLTLFLKEKGDIESLDDVVHKFMQGPDGKKCYDVAMEHLEDINYNYIKNDPQN